MGLSPMSRESVHPAPIQGPGFMSKTKSAIIEVDSHTDFYSKMSEEERAALLGKSFQEINRPSKYFCIEIPEGWRYNGQYNHGLLAVIHPMKSPKDPTRTWFKVSGIGHSGISKDLEFEGPNDETTTLFRMVSAFITMQMPRKGLGFEETMLLIEARFPQGKRTS